MNDPVKPLWLCKSCGIANAVFRGTCVFCGALKLPTEEDLPEPEPAGSEDETKILPVVKENP